ncbi:MAG: hypothetical protein ACYCR7_06470 [Thermoplasmataceae archaeon]
MWNEVSYLFFYLSVTHNAISDAMEISRTSSKIYEANLEDNLAIAISELLLV